MNIKCKIYQHFVLIFKRVSKKIYIKLAGKNLHLENVPSFITDLFFLLYICVFYLHRHFDLPCLFICLLLLFVIELLG